MTVYDILERPNYTLVSDDNTVSKKIQTSLLMSLQHFQLYKEK